MQLHSRHHHGGQANLASVNHYFGLKICSEILARRIAPVNAERLRLLDVAEKQADGSPLNAILNAFLAPPLHLYARDNEDAKHIISLLGRLHTELHTDELKKLFSMNFAKFFSALYQHCSTPYPICNSTRLRDVYFSLSVP